MSKTRFPKGIVIGSLLVIGLGAGAWSLFGGKDEKGPEVSMAVLARGELTSVVTASGDLQPVTTIDVSSQVSGLITEVLVDFNSAVKEGDVLARLDPATYEQRLKQAEADQASAKASNQLTRLNTERTRELFKRSLVTQQELDQAEAQLAQSNASLLTRNAAVEDAKVNLSRCTIYAPIDGIVMQRATEPGKTVAASLNAPTLFIIANELAKMQIVAAVAEADIGNVQEGQSVSFTVDAFPQRQFHGKVTQIRNYPKTNSNVVTYETLINVSNDDLKLKPGMTANVSIIVAQRKQALKVPNAALRVRPPDSLMAPKPTEPAIAKAGDTPKAAPKFTEEEERRIRREIMREAGFSRDSGPPTPEMIQRIQQLARERGIEIDMARFSGRMGGGSGRVSPQGGDNAISATRTVFRLVSKDPAKPLFEPVTVKLGISDSISTEIIEGLSEGDQVLTAVLSGISMPSAGGAPNPFSGRMSGPGRR